MTNKYNEEVLDEENYLTDALGSFDRPLTLSELIEIISKSINATHE